jgi:hypothetical protein
VAVTTHAVTEPMIETAGRETVWKRVAPTGSAPVRSVERRGVIDYGLSDVNVHVADILYNKQFYRKRWR